MKKTAIILSLLISVMLRSQSVCNSAGNLMLFTNYDGGTLTINVDQNIPNLKIGICSYEGVAVYLTGAFVNNVTGISYAGFNSSNNHCGSAISTNFNGVPGTATTSIIVAPTATFSNPNGNSSIICGYSCSNSSSQGGCNTVDQIEAYFLGYFTGSSLYAHLVQYGCWAGTQSVSVGGNCCPPPPVYPGVVAADQTVCAGSIPSPFSSSSSATVSAGTIGYQWQASTVSSSSGFASIFGATSSTFAPGALSQTTYFRRAASTSTSNIAYGNVITVSVLPSPAVAIAGPTLVCAGMPATLTASGGTSYAWSDGSAGATAVITPTVSTAVSVTCFAASGCTASATHMFLVNPSPTITSTQVHSITCAGQTATLHAGGAASYTWNPGNLTGASVTLVPSGTTVYTLSSTDQNGCSKSSTLLVEVAPLPTLSTTASPTLICSGRTTVLTAAGSATSFTWMPANVNTMSLSVSPTVSTVYTLTAFDGTCFASVAVSLSPLPSPTISVLVNRPKICKGEGTLLTTGGALSYTLENNALALPSHSAIVSPTITTNYTITGEATNGCTGSSVKTISVSICMGIGKQAAENQPGISIYPNPNSGEFFIAAQAACSLNIIDNAGRLVKQVVLDEKNEFRTAVTNLPAGIYFVVSPQSTFKQKIVVLK